MNRDEAIKYGTEWLKDEYLDARDGAFIEISLEALEKMPVTTTAGEGGVIYYPQVEGVTPTVVDAGKQERDAIDRAEAIKIASGYCHPANVAKELAKLPPVNPIKTGHWIKMFLTDTTDIAGQCSECGFIHKFIGGHTAQYNYCPNCGAKMSEIPTD